MGKRKPTREQPLERAWTMQRELEGRDQLIARKTGTILLVTMGVALAVPMLWRGESVQRNTYDTRDDCVRDYDDTRCETAYDNRSGHWLSYGPWYANDPERRKPGDAGRMEGRHSSLADSGGFRGVEHGTRGSFGSSGRVRAAGS